MRDTCVFLDGAAARWSATAVGQLVSATTGVPLLHVPLRHSLSYRLGRRHFDASPGVATFLPPGTEYSVGYGPECAVLGMFVTAADLDEELASRHGESPAAAHPVLAAHALGQAATMQLEQIFADLRAAGPLAPGSPGATDLRARLVSWAADLIAREVPGSAASAASAARMRRVEEWIDANLGEPITMGQLCAVAGLEASSLRKSFRKRRAVSPMDWVWQRRMATARMRLLVAGPGEKVIQIANDCGLSHAGRFSVEYRERYGESPSITLARAAA